MSEVMRVRIEGRPLSGQGSVPWVMLRVSDVETGKVIPVSGGMPIKLEEVDGAVVATLSIYVHAVDIQADAVRGPGEVAMIQPESVGIAAYDGVLVCLCHSAREDDYVDTGYIEKPR